MGKKPVGLDGVLFFFFRLLFVSYPHLLSFELTISPSTLFLLYKKMPFELEFIGLVVTHVSETFLAKDFSNASKSCSFVFICHIYPLSFHGMGILVKYIAFLL